MRILMAIIIAFVAINATAEALNEEPLSSLLQGTYRVTDDAESVGPYLNCQAGQVVEVHFSDNSIQLKGLTHSPISFKNINEGPVGTPGPLVGFSQRRTTFKEVAHQHYQLLSEHRDCEPLLSNIGCFGKKWRTTTSVVFYVEDGEADAPVWTIMDFSYQPFATVNQEVCQLQQASRSAENL